MSYITRDVPDAEYAGLLESFLGAAAENADALGLSPVEIEAMQNEVDAYRQSVSDVFTARANYAGAVSAKEARKARTQAMINGAAKVWRANIAISPEILDQVMVAPHKTPRTLTTPNMVTDVTLTPNEVGELTIRWNVNGNIPKTVYIIEMASDSRGPWTQISAVTTRKFRYVGTPGTQVWFRVSARRRGISSSPCNPVGIWSNGLQKAA